MYTVCPGVYDPNNHCFLTAHMIHQARLSRLILKLNFSQRRPIQRPSDQDFQENQPLLCLLRIFSLPLVEKLPFCPGKLVSDKHGKRFVMLDFWIFHLRQANFCNLKSNMPRSDNRRIRLQTPGNPAVCFIIRFSCFFQPFIHMGHIGIPCCLQGQ